MKGMPGLVIGVLAFGLAALTASRLAGQVRSVDMMTLFGAGFAAGAGVIGAILRRRHG
jgi:hypothetical protein